MNSRGRTLRLAGVSAAVVLCLTGFTGRSHGHSYSHSRHSSGGGGCSSSHQDHDTSTHRSRGYGSSGGYRTPYRNRHTPSSSPTGTTRQDATARLLRCASAKTPFATVEVANPNSASGTFTVTVGFRDAGDLPLVSRPRQVQVPARGKATVKVPVATAADAAKVAHCVVDSVAPPATR
ncbi:hypothetical protein [Streptomyces tropicalis]|uniref:Secreted protein n=1 Tax=Streptomyces tropicalis TaxID=3034234 RepID=A0ABT6A7A4_9ACTN|nr:hypothetical protein [Streptomyces tropicalis]MDF3300522.1 hypothetical protein [Streptomyces tropicalis]